MSTIITYPCAYAVAQAPTFVETYETSSPEFESDYHLHADADWEVQFIPHGRAGFSLNEEPVRVNSGELIIINPDQPHVCENSLGRRRAITFRPESLRLLPFEARRDRKTGGLRIDGRALPTHLVVPVRHRALLERTVAHLECESLLSEPMARGMCMALLAQFLLLTARQAAESHGSPVPAVSLDARLTIEQFCAEVRAQLDYPWTLTEMSRRSGYSAPQLCRLFDQVTALSPCRWLREERVREARALLAQTDKRMAEIAVEVGFESRCQLHRVFRESTGMTPNQYRELTRPTP